jgi:hypothetical protein
MDASTAMREVSAYNTAATSDNKIHDDSVARRFGFRGGLVPGVEVYAYMAHMPVARWARAWLERGCADCRFWKPVYDGALARVTATEESGACRERRRALRDRAREHPVTTARFTHRRCNPASRAAE